MCGKERGVCVCVCYNTHAGYQETDLKKFQGLNSGPQTWLQAPLPVSLLASPQLISADENILGKLLHSG